MLKRTFVFSAAIGVLLLLANSALCNRILVPNLGIDYRFLGGSWVQNDPQTALSASVVMGAGLGFEALAVGNNRIGISAGYLAHLRSKTYGTAQINVETFRQQTDFTVFYRYQWDYVSLAGAVGASMVVLSVTTRIYNIGPLDVAADGQQYAFSNRTVAVEEKSVGTVWGPTVVCEVGLDLGRLALRGLTRFDNFLFYNLAVQYAERDGKHEAIFWSSFSIFPMALSRNEAY